MGKLVYSTTRTSKLWKCGGWAVISTLESLKQEIFPILIGITDIFSFSRWLLDTDCIQIGRSTGFFHFQKVKTSWLTLKQVTKHQESESYRKERDEIPVNSHRELTWGLCPKSCLVKPFQTLYDHHWWLYKVKPPGIYICSRDCLSWYCKNIVINKFCPMHLPLMNGSLIK